MSSINPHRVSHTVLAALALAGAAHALHAGDVARAANGNDISTGAAWTGGNLPTVIDRATWNASATGNNQVIGGNVSWGGIYITSTVNTSVIINNTTSQFTVSLGSLGIDLNNGAATNRGITFGSNIGVNLTANQTWALGNSTGTGGVIQVSGNMIGTGALNITRSANGNGYVYLLNGGSTFSGGVTLQSGSALRLGGTAVGTGGTTAGTLTSSAIGTGNLTINGGIIYGGSGVINPNTIFINSDFQINAGTNTANGRLSLAGNLDLGSATRTVTLGRWNTIASGNITVGGLESVRFLNTTSNTTVLNGTLRFARDTVGATSNDYVSVNFGSGNVIFTGGAGLTIGDRVVTTFSTGNPFGSTAGNQPNVTVESGGIFNLSDQANSRSPTVRSLSGAGTVTNLSNTSTTGTLTINPQAGDTYEFSGNIVNGASMSSIVPSAVGVIAITKTGAGTQILSGTNSYTGATAVSAGALVFANTGARSASSSVTTSGSTTTIGLGLDGGFTSSDVDSLFANTFSGITMNSTASNVANVGVYTATGNTATYSGGSQGTTRGLNKLGAGTVAMTGASTYTGTTTISAGTLSLGNGGTTGTLSTSSAIVTNGTFAINRSNTVAQGTDFSGAAITGTGGFSQIGSGTTTLSAANTYTGATTIAAGTLGLSGASERIANTSNLVLAGGTFALNGFTETMAALTLSGSATIDLGSGGRLLLANSSAASWTNGMVLTIAGTFVSGTSLQFGNNSSGLTNAQLSQIQITGFQNLALDSSGFLTGAAIPEPSTYALLAGCAGLGLVIYRRRRQKAQALAVTQKL
jgi:autotransporter-associated beta strand protein